MDMIDTNPIVRSVARAIDGAISRAVQGANSTNWNPVAEVDRFRGVRDKTLEILDQLTVTQAQWSPGTGKWSILEIADHLLLTEEMYRGQFESLVRMSEEGRGSTMQISLSEVDVGIPGIPKQVAPFFEMPMRMFNLFVPHVLRETIVRYPIVVSLNPRQSQPREGVTLAQLRRDLAESVNRTERFILTRLPHDVEDLTISHPVLGNNSIPQLFRIVIAHEQRHQEQIQRIQEDGGFPRISQEPMNAASMADLFDRGA